MKFQFSPKKIAPLASVLMALTLAGCVDEGRYYHVETRVTDGPNYPRHPGRVAPPPRHHDYDRWDRRDRPPRGERNIRPPSIYDERGRRHEEPRHYDERQRVGARSIYEYSGR
jgi:hypothetical protein